MGPFDVALSVLSDVDKGHFASESMRQRTSGLDGSSRRLTVFLVYAVCRKKELWIKLIQQYLRADWRSLEPQVRNALLLGTAGLAESDRLNPSSLVNAVTASMKKKGYTRASKLVNAVLRKVAENISCQLLDLGRSGNIENQALLSGVPLFALKEWEKDLGLEDTRQLLKYNTIKPFLSLRVSPGIEKEKLLEGIYKAGFLGWLSPLVPGSIRLAGSAHPPDVFGFNEGYVTPQSESSILAGAFFSSLYNEGVVLDMCAGRGIKTGQFLQDNPNAIVEAWDISLQKTKGLDRELKRLGLYGKATIRQGDALHIKPENSPSLVFVDAPCSGSGTWKRHPETKWKTNLDTLEDLNIIQEKLLEKAINMVAPGGIVVYSTCSLFKRENEHVISKVLKRYNNIEKMEIPLYGKYIRAGNVGKYIWPALPWLDGFYLAAFGRNF